MAPKPRPISRRDALKFSATSFALVVATGASTKTVLAALNTAPVRVRRNINDPVFGAEVAAAYRKAIGILKKNKDSDPKSFEAQHSIHTKFCPHGNWYFLPWHRAYLTAFEAICADVLGDPSFGLPYWDWTEDRILPPAVAAEIFGGQPNPLFNNSRFMTATMTLSESLRQQFRVDAERIFGRAKIKTLIDSTTYQAFGSLKPTEQNDTSVRWQREPGRESGLEREPHDFCHGGVGGDMRSPITSPNDPVFYLHHCNLDRLWARWNSTGKLNDSDPLWHGFTFPGNFWDVQGRLIDVKVSSLFDTVDLGYRFDNIAAPVLTMARPAEAGAASSKFDIVSTNVVNAKAPLNTATELPVSIKPIMNGMEAMSASAESARDRVFAFITDVSVPAERDIGVRVYINCPYLAPDTPSDDPHYAGAFTFFADSGGETHGSHTKSFALDITETLAAVRRAGTEIFSEIVVQLMPVGPGVSPGQGNFTVGSVEIATLSA